MQAFWGELIPGVAPGVTDVVASGQHPVAEVALAEAEPNALDRIALRAVSAIDRAGEAGLESGTAAFGPDLVVPERKI